jgi:zinc protease
MLTSPLSHPFHCCAAGRLFNRVRSREGLAYSISGGWSSTPIDHPGLFMATAETAKPAALLTALRGVLEEAASTAPPEEEVQRAKQAALNQFVFSFASRSAQLSRIISFDLVGIPQDYVFK